MEKDIVMEVFNSTEFGSIRVIREGDKLLLCGRDVALALGYATPQKAIRDHCRCVLKRSIPHPQNPAKLIEMSFLTEGDVYRLIIRCKLPCAEQFERWVFDEVLPSIRKQGFYMTDKLRKQLAASEDKRAALEKLLGLEQTANALLQLENGVLAGKAEYYDAFVDADYCTNLRTTAKQIGVPEKKFVLWLQIKHYLYRAPTGTLLPYAEPYKRGLFTVRDYCRNGHSGCYTLFTPLGKRYFYHRRNDIMEVI